MQKKSRIQGTWRALLAPTLVSAVCTLGWSTQASAQALSPGRYVLTLAHSGKCLDIRGGSTADGAVVQQYSCNGSAAQQFIVQSPSAGRYVLVNANSGKCLTVQGASTANSAAIQQASCSGATSQQFTLQNPAVGQYALVNVNSGKCLDLQYASTADSAPVLQYTCGGAANQRFVLKPQAEPSVLPAPAASPNPVVNYEYNAEGSPTKTVQAPGVAGMGFETKTSYDTLERPKDITDAKSGVTKFEYDGQDNTTKVTDPRNLETKYPRNGLGDATQLISPDTGTATHTYDAAGNLKTRTDSRGVLATYTYDSENRQTGVVYSQSGQPSQSFTYGYDLTGPGYGAGIGRLSRTDHPNGATRYEYDNWGRPTADVQRINAATGANSVNMVFTVGYSYDALGQVTGITYPSGRKLTLGYTNGQLTGMGLAKDTSSTATPLLSDIQWEPFGAARSWKWNMATGLKAHERRFDTAGRMTRYPLGPVVRDLKYDEADRIKSYTHLLATTGAAQTALDQSFVYDALGRLTNVTANGSSWTIGYDANGNRTGVTLNGVARAYTTAATSNRLNGISNPARALQYDNAGNTTQDTERAYTTTYDLSNRMATLNKGGVTTTYTYDGLGRRIRKVSSTGAPSTVLFVYGQEGQLLGEYDATGKALREYVWLGSTPVAIFTPDQANAANPPIAYYVHTDHLDTPRIVVDRNDKRRWRWLAEPFGTTAPETNPDGVGVFAQNLRFPGQYADQESGLFYNYFRDYDAGMGRYTTSDPIGLEGGINTFSYTGGNPIGRIDPRGLSWWSDLTRYFGAEAHYVIGAGLTSVTCTDECGRKQTFRYKKVCVGGAAGVGGSFGVVGNMNGKACRGETYEGYFSEFGYTAGVVSGGFDLGFGETDWKIPGTNLGLPYGLNGVTEGALGPGLGAGLKVTWCYYVLIP